MTLLLGLVGLVAPAVMAAKGVGYRGLYAAVALAAFLLAFFTLSLVAAPSVPTTEAEAAGVEVLATYGPPFAAMCLGLGIGGLFGALLYRRPTERAVA